VERVEVQKSSGLPVVHAEFKLSAGRVVGNTLKMSPESVVLIKTPSGNYQIK
jgi:hypothetical protein